MPGQRPSLTSTSLWQTPHAVTLTRTLPGGGSGIGRSTISNSRFAAGICATRIVVIKPLLYLFCNKYWGYFFNAHLGLTLPHGKTLFVFVVDLLNYFLCNCAHVAFMYVCSFS